MPSGRRKALVTSVEDQACLSALESERDAARRLLLKARVQVNMMRQHLEDATAMTGTSLARRYSQSDEAVRTNARRVLDVCNRIEADDLVEITRHVTS